MLLCNKWSLPGQSHPEPRAGAPESGHSAPVNNLLTIRSDLKRLGIESLAVTGKEELRLGWQVVFGGEAFTGTLSPRMGCHQLVLSKKATQLSVARSHNSLPTGAKGAEYSL